MRARRLLSISVLGAVLVLGLVVQGRVLAQTDPVAYFGRTGLNVSGAFLRFYESHGGPAVFGYPLTREFVEDGRTVQYFQCARLEKYADGDGQTRVVLGKLGELLREPDPPIPDLERPSATHAGRQYFPETGHTVSFSFLDFYRSHGGVETLGYPITEWIIEPNGRIVQYFERVKMEWYPEHPPARRVRLGELGTIYVASRVDPRHTRPEDAFIAAKPEKPVVAQAAPVEPSALRLAGLEIRTSVEQSISGRDSEQVVHVYVADGQGGWVQGASVEVEVWYEGQEPVSFSLPVTGATGYTRLAFTVGSAPVASTVLVKANVRYGHLFARTDTSFLHWW